MRFDAGAVEIYWQLCKDVRAERNQVLTISDRSVLPTVELTEFVKRSKSEVKNMMQVLFPMTSMWITPPPLKLAFIYNIIWKYHSSWIPTFLEKVCKDLTSRKDRIHQLDKTNTSISSLLQGIPCSVLGDSKRFIWLWRWILNITWAQTIVRASHCVGLTFPCKKM